MKKISVLIFEGSPIKEIASLGAWLGTIRALNQQALLDNLRSVGGSFSGALMALLLALQYSEDELQEVVWSESFKKFLGPSSPANDLNKTANINANHSPNQNPAQNKECYAWLSSLIARKTNDGHITLIQLKDKRFIGEPFLDFHCMGYDARTEQIQTFTAENIDLQQTTLAEAVYNSLAMQSVIWPYTLVPIRSTRHTQPLYDDKGALLGYAPFKIFPGHLSENLGLRLDSIQDIPAFLRHGVLQYDKKIARINPSKDLDKTALSLKYFNHFKSNKWEQAFFNCPQVVNTMNFELSVAEKNALIQSGKDGTLHFLKSQPELFNPEIKEVDEQDNILQALHSPQSLCFSTSEPESLSLSKISLGRRSSHTVSCGNRTLHLDLLEDPEQLPKKDDGHVNIFLIESLEKLNSIIRTMTKPSHISIHADNQTVPNSLPQFQQPLIVRSNSDNLPENFLTQTQLRHGRSM